MYSIFIPLSVSLVSFHSTDVNWAPIRTRQADAKCLPSSGPRAEEAAIAGSDDAITKLREMRLVTCLNETVINNIKDTERFNKTNAELSLRYVCLSNERCRQVLNLQFSNSWVSGPCYSPENQ